MDDEEQKLRDGADDVDANFFDLAEHVQERMMELEVCCFCNQVLYNVHETNNAMPVRDGRCCHRCNAEIVIPARMIVIWNQIDIWDEEE